ncbi:MAG: sigma factor-like helix-turn-helix DNA-binding protein, partial [Patescibacteria group bacterium]|nr:sigma factor-like helix-turn-helix DNA-binding protein [Patescibacteria group bacterium]
MEESILDKVISSKQSQELREFNPPEVAASLLKQLSNKEEDILRRRYGLNGKSKQTLEEIGKFYNLTRERIRQIESTAIKKTKGLKNFSSLIEPIEHAIQSVLEQNGGAMSKERLMEELFEFSTDTPISRQSVSFIISQLLSDRFVSQPANDYFRSSWYLPTVSLEKVKRVIDKLINLIKSKNQPLSESDFIQAFQTAHSAKDSNTDSDISDQTIVGYLTMSQKVSRNPFGEYGLTEWGTIVPRRMNDKIYLVLKKEGKPMHFT